MAFARSSAILAVVALLASPLLASAMLRQPFSQTKFGRSLAAGETMPRLGANFTYYTFENKLDHFDPLNTATYKQRYAVDASAWSPGGPIFIFLSGEAPMEFFEFQEVSAVNWAHHFGAQYISLEHRYYGESNPVPDYSTDNMRYLSSRQALADAAEFIVEYNKTLEHPGDWVVFGCSYSGALSSWFRAKYPNLVVASIAPSGPVQAESNFTTFLGQFSKSAAPTCVSAVATAVEAISVLLQTSAGRASLAKTFNTCEPIEASNYNHFLSALALTIGSADQMDNPSNEGQPWLLNTTCDLLTRKGDIVANFAAAYDLNVGEAGATQCNNFQLSNFISELQNTSVAATSADRSWWFQKCTEFGFFKPTYANTSVFWAPLPVEKISAYCAMIFGIPNMQPNTENTNSYYGGYDLQASNVLFTNGLLDPWHLLSITEDQTPTQQSYVQAVTYEAGHCAPMTTPTANDPPSLKAARQKVESFLGGILGITPETSFQN